MFQLSEKEKKLIKSAVVPDYEFSRERKYVSDCGSTCTSSCGSECSLDCDSHGCSGGCSCSKGHQHYKSGN